MKKRIDIENILRSNDPEKLIVYKACSLENEIRFYTTDKQYFVARDNNDGTLLVKYGEDQEEENTENDKQKNKNRLTHIKKKINIKNLLKILALSLFVTLLLGSICMVVAILTFLTKNIFISLLIVSITIFFSQIITVMIWEYKYTSISVKSKHSAEHMMANFLEKNKKVTKNIREIKETSRFNDKCNSKEIIKSNTEQFIQNLFTIIILLIIASFATQKFENTKLLRSILIIGLFPIYIVIGTLMRKYNKLNFVINPIQKILNYILQCSNTTKYVENHDIELAYYAAKYWLKLVYPEFYNEDGNIFNESKES